MADMVPRFFPKGGFWWERWSDGSLSTAKGYVVVIEYNTEADGTPVEPGKAGPVTIHGPFDTEDAAKEWDQNQPDDTDVRDAFYLHITAALDAYPLAYVNDPSERE